MDALVIESLTFRYREREEPTIQDLSLSIAAGELLLVAGASGSGKTTLIRCINGLVPRSYKGEMLGRVFLHGQDNAAMPLARISQIVGTVLQDPERQILGTRVRNEVAFGLENQALERAEIQQSVDEALAYLGIAGLQERETFHLSGGEKQKVALAGILAMRPSILLLDEPLASLDPASSQDTLALVRQMVDEGMTVLMVEHRVEDVLGMRPDRVLYMEGGRSRYLGPVEGLGKVVDYKEIKLPAREVIARAKDFPPPPEVRFYPAMFVGPTSPAAPGSAPYSEGKPGSPEALVRFERVCFAYGDVQGSTGKGNVLDGIDLEIRRGDVVAILGPNGAGKTTLVKHAIGLLKPKSGRVLVNGKDTRQLSVAQIAKTLGYVFQSPSHMLFAPTVNEELAFGPTNLGHPSEVIQKEVQEAIQIVNLSGREKDPPLALSFGQQKRVSIAAILAMRSRILVMDEPTAGQDYQNYMSFMDTILQLPNFEAILFITHDLDLAIIYATRVLLVNQGRLVADGPPYEVLADAGRLSANRIVPTSLLEMNLQYLPRTGRFLRAEALAHVNTN
jgi:energy-coupling factor transport system ATP-binding protein